MMLFRGYGIEFNRKRVWLLYRSEGLTVRLGGCTRESVDASVDRSICGAYVARGLVQAGLSRGTVRPIRTDQAPELISKALDQWAYERGC